MQLYQTSGGDLFADAFFILHERLMFASLYGRDANMLSLLARLNKGDQEPISFRLPEKTCSNSRQTAFCPDTAVKQYQPHPCGHGFLSTLWGCTSQKGGCTPVLLEIAS